MLLSKRESNIDLFFARGRHSNIDLHYVSQSYFHLPKNTILNNSNMNFFKKKKTNSKRYYTIIPCHSRIRFLDLEEWKQLCRNTWENDYEYLQIDRFAK